MYAGLSSCRTYGACQACRFFVVLVFWMSFLERPRDNLFASEPRRASTEMLVLPLGRLDLVMGFCFVF